MNALKRALLTRKKLGTRIETILRRDYPVGSTVQWTHHRFKYEGVVTANCPGDRLKVRNIMTGQERFIFAEAIVLEIYRRHTGRAIHVRYTKAA